MGEQQRSRDPRAEDDTDEDRALQAVAARMFRRVELPHIDRFTVLERVGEGGMGTVYAVWDPRLDRKVALKLLRPHPDRSAEDLLLREARALARLSHPNVVPLFEVGVHDGRVFLAMEFVSGSTLTRWAAQEPRSWRAVLDVYAQAGAGLAAAHAAGIVHRDFKPDNALIGDEGARVRVVDFGLARTGPALGEAATATADVGSGSTASAIAGTPAFMAPEQIRGDAVDARSDQFAFAVSLYRALYRLDPFGGVAARERLDRIERGEVDPAPRDADVPEWVRAVVLCGLRAAPDERFASMQALLDALAADPSLRRRRSVLVAAMVLAAGLGVAGIVSLATRDDPADELCSGATAQLAEVWDEAARARVESAIAATGLSYARSTWTRVSDAIDRYAAGWEDAYVEACVATNVRGEASAEAMDLKVACLHGHRRELTAVVDVLSRANAKIVENAHTAVAGLPPLEACADLDALRADPTMPRDPTLRATVEPLQQELARARGFLRAEQLDDAEAVLVELAQRVEHAGFDPLRADLELAGASLHKRRRAFEEARVHYRRAFVLSTAARHDDAAAEAANELVQVAARLGNTEDGREWAELADAAVRRLGERGGQRRADLENELAALAAREGDYEQALAHTRRGLELARTAFRDDEAVAGIYSINLATMLTEAGRLDEALPLAIEAVAIFDRTLGPEHRRAADALGVVASVQALLGHYDDAEEAYVRALAVLAAALGGQHPDVARVELNLGVMQQQRGVLTEAELHIRRAVAILEALQPDEHALLGSALASLGAVMRDRGELHEALRILERGLELRQRALGADHPKLVGTLNAIGQVRGRLGDFDSALRDYDEALAIAEAQLGPEHDDVATVLGNRSAVLADIGRADEAIAALERVIAIREKAGHGKIARAYAGLAELMRERGELGRARELFARAVAACDAGEPSPDACEEARAGAAAVASP